MDSVKMYKGYGKVEQEHDLEDQENRNPNPKPKPKPFIATISIFAILFLVFTFAFALASLLHHHTHSNQQLLNSAESIRVVCNVTRFPAACLAAIPPSADATDPKAILALSLRASVHALQDLAASLKGVGPVGPALADCKDQFDDALSRLNESAAAALTEAAVADVQTWVSAAVTDQQTCLDGLEEVGDVAGVEEMKKMMNRANEYTSNSLAIVANIRNLLLQFHMPLH
ncbi:hypothetical protein VNO78_02882 [Psophocarpus tetragonolobus]|uniref:pectinesterase n=1 Tax=Psophocarpus tetragonolobus TaxID=3891 RepID=A0AAN9XWF3_PSOTE